MSQSLADMERLGSPVEQTESSRRAGRGRELLVSFREALAELSQHKLRTLLTLLGMIFGVGAVIAMLNIGKGAEQEALRMIETMGLNNLIVQSPELEKEELYEQRKQSAGLSLRDGEAALATLGFVEAFAAQKSLETYSVFSEYGKSEAAATGVSPGYFRMSPFQLSEGRLIIDQDEQQLAQVAVLGESVARQLFPSQPVLGERIKVNHLWFTVVGVLDSPFVDGAEFEGVRLGAEQNQIFIPFATAMQRFPHPLLAAEVSELKFQLAEGTDANEAARAITHLLNRRHNNVKDFTMVVPAALMAQKMETQTIFNIVMSCVAGISLLVGGIGIMNIMLATVLERTREIGLLRAVGATQRDIRTQYLVESFTIAILGGLLGILFGVLLSEAIALYAGWAVSWSLQAILLSFSVCALIGLVFGVYPAIKASKLNPIDALQSD
ncbi:Macrolide export ATP-binding/permease protein MacB [Microbulbifer aggregans]|uniref:Macrolide export ATP-binding/permease protein MacB n=1 Tax=Microbulbifer aggregans TaxID=1769779 RepID=A0A1C9W3H7_9GAMM|nr:ABC transporter permease [Microbulbifer aggregans]AOS95684.1 Macrolide export ATP-binding/permease protein MacB [Microbulbifer aggregans]